MKSIRRRHAPAALSAESARRLVDRRGLDRGDLVLAEALADDIKSAGQRGIAERPVRSRGETASGWWRSGISPDW